MSLTEDERQIIVGMELEKALKTFGLKNEYVACEKAETP